MVSEIIKPAPIKPLTPADCELLTFARIGAQHRVRESFLIGEKWFDYRGLHPMQATTLYATLYERAVKTIYAETKDRAAADSIKVFPVGIYEGRELTGLWLARQALDRICVRYEFALAFAMRRFTTRGWKMFPRPNQLYGEELILDIQDAWRLECGASLQIAKNETFRVDHFVGHPDQIAYREWLIQQVKLRPAAEYPLSRLISERLLPEDVIEKTFGAKTLGKAKSLCF